MRRFILRETQRAVTPFGGFAVFVSFLSRIGLAEKVRHHMSVRWTSPNQVEPTGTFIALLISVLAGAKRFAHASVLRGDRTLHVLLGLDRFPTDDTIRNLFQRFGMGQVKRLFEPIAEWQMERLPLQIVPSGSSMSTFAKVPGPTWLHETCIAPRSSAAAKLRTGWPR
jgi:hypothetical protein